MEIKIATFLTDNHTLVEHYEFIKTPDAGVSIQFFINAPSKTKLDMSSEPVIMDDFFLETVPEKSLIVCKFSKQDVSF